MKYLSVAPPSTAAAERYIWVTERADATRFSTLAEAEAAKSTVPATTAIIGGWFVVKA
jgi:hypothetical protein